MKIKAIKHKALSHVSYLIQSDQEAALIDPLRGDINYLQFLEEGAVQLKYIFLTHAYLDLLTDHIDIAERTGAEIIIGSEFQPKFKAIKSEAGQSFSLGRLVVISLPTPGYTIDSQSWLVIEDEEPKAVFVGKAINFPLISMTGGIWSNANKEELATKLYDTLFVKLGTLPHNITLYQSSKYNNEISLMEARTQFPILKSANKETFVQNALQEIKEWPAHYQDLKSLNLKMNASELQPIKPMSVAEVQSGISEHHWQVVDIRPHEKSTLSFIPKSILVGLEGDFEYWMLRLINPDKPVLLVGAQKEDIEIAIQRLKSVGLEKVIGYLQGGYDAWLKEGKRMDMLIDVEVEEFVLDLKFDEQMNPLDVRSKEEFEISHLQEVQHIPLEQLNDPLHMSGIDEEMHYYVYSENSYRAIIACSLLKKEGFYDVRYVKDGYKNIQEQEEVVIMVPKIIKNDELE